MTTARVRTSPLASLTHLGQRWDLFGLFVEDHILDPEDASARGLLELLWRLNGRWHDRDVAQALAVDLMQITDSDAESLVGQLCELYLLESTDDPQGQRLDSPALEQWRAADWEESARFMLTCHRHPKLDYTKPSDVQLDERMMQRKVDEAPPPSNYKDLPGEVIALPDDDVPVGDVLEGLRAPKTFRSEPVSLRELGWFLRLAYGQTGSRQMIVTGSHLIKTSPSGGSRHPTEVAVLPLAVEGLAPALYHYSVREHGLVRIAGSPTLQALSTHVYCKAEWPGFDPAALVFYSTVFDRSMHRYREAFSYRVMHHDIGHLMQTARSLAWSRRRRIFHSYSLDDSIVETWLGLDGTSEAVMAWSALG